MHTTDPLVQQYYLPEFHSEQEEKLLAFSLPLFKKYTLPSLGCFLSLAHSFYYSSPPGCRSQDYWGEGHRDKMKQVGRHGNDFKNLNPLCCLVFISPFPSPSRPIFFTLQTCLVPQVTDLYSLHHLYSLVL